MYERTCTYGISIHTLHKIDLHRIIRCEIPILKHLTLRYEASRPRERRQESIRYRDQNHADLGYYLTVQ